MSASRFRLLELLRTKKNPLGVVTPCMFSSRASRPAWPRSMNGVGSLKYAGSPRAAGRGGCVNAIGRWAAARSRQPLAAASRQHRRCASNRDELQVAAPADAAGASQIPHHSDGPFVFRRHAHSLTWPVARSGVARISRCRD